MDLFSTQVNDIHKVTTLHEKCPNTEFFLVRIQSECGEIRARKNSVFRLFSRSATIFKENSILEY